ncbi:hypothetical protein BDZ45DRAFT_677160 [Acephala macrosclerotiorum]|nr:hypothetical protein BDZ45DRAFT_677160 [Acephala macrosclerotiorum]
MLLLLDFFFARVVVRSELLRSWTPPVRISTLHTLQQGADSNTDCPEREATYIITTGGINDPEKA